MVDFTKHVGRNKNGTRLVVVFREIPDDEEHCLVVETDSLPDMYHDQLLQEVDSRDAQATVDLYEVLQRRSFGDGGQMLNTLHNRGFLRKYKVSQIEMQPMPSRLVALSLVNEQIKNGTMESEQSESEQSEQAKVTAETVETVRAVDDTGVSVDTEAGLVQPTTVAPVTIGEDVDAKAAGESKLLQARLMEEDAKKLRKEAYELNPDLKKGGRPKKDKVK